MGCFIVPIYSGVSVVFAYQVCFPLILGKIFSPLVQSHTFGLDSSERVDLALEGNL